MFEPNDSWLEGLPEEPALRRLQEEPEVEIWPDISRMEAVGFGWLLLVEDRAEEVLERAVGVPGFRWAAAGLLDPEVDRGLESGRQRFGIVFYVEDPLSQPAMHGLLRFDDARLPIALRPVSYEEHAPAPEIPNGTVACWATSAAGTREGWLTARHVAFSGGYEMVDCGRECIDAALIGLGSDGTGRPVRAVPPSPGATVEVRGPHPTATTVLDVALDLGIGASSYFPLRFTTAAVGVPGDSGSLIVADPCREPVGIYLGAARLDSGQEAGIGLAITQLEKLMKMEVYL
jgi:hypothetical protein